MIGGFHFAAPAPPLLSVRASPMVPSIHDRLLSYCLFVCVTYVAQAENEAARRAYFYERRVASFDDKLSGRKKLNWNFKLMT